VTAARVRDWSTIDFYAVLGVDADATDSEIAQAFRARAKQLHPDVATDTDASDRFHDLSAAYAVLSDPRRRRDYDRVRATPTSVPTARSERVVQSVRPSVWTRRRSAIALVGGIVVTILGVVAAGFTWHLHDRDADRRAASIPVTATRIGSGRIQFVTRAGERVETREPRRRGEASGRGSTVDVRYDPDDPRTVVVDAGSFGRDITLAIVALKFLVGGPVFAFVGARHLRRRTDLRMTENRST
jgi:curved DNA-binding protein CbpA